MSQNPNPSYHYYLNAQNKNFVINLDESQNSNNNILTVYVHCLVQQPIDLERLIKIIKGFVLLYYSQLSIQL